MTTDPERDRLVADCDRLRAAWRVAERTHDYSRALTAYHTYTAACAAWYEYDTTHGTPPLVATPEPLPSQQPEASQPTPEDAEPEYPRRRKGDR